MKLSIHTIFEELFSEKGTLVAGDDIAINLSGIRLFKGAHDNLTEQNIYLLTQDQYVTLDPNPLLNLICIGFPEQSKSAKDFKAVLFLPNDTETVDILSQIQSVFDRYQEWESNIHQAILQGRPLQSTLDLCSIVLKNPIALFDNQQNLLMKAGTIPENAEGSLWDYVLKKGYSPKESEADFLRRELQNNPKPFYYRSKDLYRNINRLIAGLHHRHTLFGCLAISDISAPITKSEYAMMYTIQQFMELALLHSEEYKSFASETPWYITQLLQGNPVERSVLYYNLSQKEKSPEQSYFIWTFLPLDQTITDTFLIEDWLPNFNRHFKKEFLFTFNNQIIVIDYLLKNYDDKSYLESVHDFLSVCGFKGAFSMIFHDISEIRQAYRQCQIAFDGSYQKNPVIHDFRKHYVNFILSSIHKEMDSNDLLYPGIKALLKKDDHYGLELLRCLQEYIISGKNVSATAEVLYIHRHTVLYRLNNISQMMKIDFSTLDEDSLLHIYLSCRILIKYCDESAKNKQLSHRNKL
ncbi:helix-turn-helix domain-containing protein [Dehalobacter sp. DCM]|uniref:PucR family transcriptional regulator n=1 Tax=Dehalobacter sp. DCM TaxID=2907827 RepID=UPI003081E8D1|nr:helix-turn-helix domain-containing protein [Dehalobacter sp. DCM]